MEEVNEYPAKILYDMVRYIC